VFVKLILPALLEAKDPGFRPIMYALFPPLGLAALAGYLDPDDQVVLEDEHVMPLTTDDRPDLVVMVGRYRQRRWPSRSVWPRPRRRPCIVMAVRLGDEMVQR
jgi:hypothetical protein